MDPTWKMIGKYMSQNHFQDHTVDQVAQTLGLTKKETRRVLEGMAAMGILRRLTGGKYVMDHQPSLIGAVRSPGR